jgi:hypothetical protein
VKQVDAYFMAGERQRVDMSDHDVLRRYWREWAAHASVLRRDTAWPPGRRLEREPCRYWEQLAEAAGSMASAQRVLIGRYGLSLLRRYRCHRC